MCICCIWEGCLSIQKMCPLLWLDLRCCKKLQQLNQQKQQQQSMADGAIAMLRVRHEEQETREEEEERDDEEEEEEKWSSKEAREKKIKEREMNVFSVFNSASPFNFDFFRAIVLGRDAQLYLRFQSN